MPEPDVEELPDAGARQVANGAVDERPVGLGDAGGRGSSASSSAAAARSAAKLWLPPRRAS
ncbi:MAG: hypothetical protein QOE61_3224 [Micromonosporaceae bacterium]|jgi:hypothetical protein|nr:hypothetical protein [Micromonosporaceae bacterium]